MYNRGLFRFVLQKDYIFLLKVKALLIKKGDAHCTDARGPTLKSMEEITLDTSGVLMLLLSTTKLVRTCIFTVMKNILSPIVIVMMYIVHITDWKVNFSLLFIYGMWARRAILWAVLSNK